MDLRRINLTRPMRHLTSGLGLLLLALLLVSPLTLFAHGDLDIRIAAATAAIAQDTNNATLYLQRAELHREHKDWPAATADYDTVARLDPNLKNVDYYRGRMLADANELTSARETFDRFLARQPGDGLGYIERARVFVRLGSLTNAIADFSAGLKLLREPQPEFYLELAQALQADHRADEALRRLDDGVKRLGPIITLQVLAMDLELKQKKFDAALARLETIITQAARKERWLAQRGDIELLASRPEAARRSYKAALVAITRLPTRLQTLPPMMELKARVNAALEKLSQAAAETSG